MAASTPDLDQDSTTSISAINVTPFVDVVLVLLVIFMVTAPALMKETFSIKLPNVKSAGKTPDQPLGVAVTAQGQILLNGQLVADEALVSAVKSALERNTAGTTAVISADRDARHGDVAHAIDLLKSAGLERFAFQIQRETKP